MADPIGAAAEEAAKVAAAGVMGALLIWAGLKRQKVKAWYAARKARRPVALLAAAIGELRAEIAELRAENAELRASVATIEVLGRSQSDLATEGTFECNSDGEFTFVNRTFHLMVGVGRNDLMGKRWKQYVHPEDAVRFAEQMDSSLRENRMLGTKVRFLRPDGDVLRFDITMLPWPDLPPTTKWFCKARLLA